MSPLSPLRISANRAALSLLLSRVSHKVLPLPVRLDSPLAVFGFGVGDEAGGRVGRAEDVVSIISAIRVPVIIMVFEETILFFLRYRLCLV